MSLHAYYLYRGISELSFNINTSCYQLTIHTAFTLSSAQGTCFVSSQIPTLPRFKFYLIYVSLLLNSSNISSILLAASPHFDPPIVSRGLGVRQCGEANTNPPLLSSMQDHMAMEIILDVGGWYQSAVFLHGQYNPWRVDLRIGGAFETFLPNTKTPFNGLSKPFNS